MFLSMEQTRWPRASCLHQRYDAFFNSGFAILSNSFDGKHIEDARPDAKHIVLPPSLCVKIVDKSAASDDFVHKF
jgi:hypothetical protein